MVDLEVTELDPYAPPKAALDIDAPSGRSAVEQVRRGHLEHECAVRTVGSLCYVLAAVFLILVALSSFWSRGGASTVAVALFAGVLCAGLAVLGWGLRKLKTWVKVPLTIVAGFGLLAIPFGTICSSYILYLVLSTSGRTVFSTTYRDTIAQTTHVKPKTSTRQWLLLVIAMVLLGFQLVALVQVLVLVFGL